MKWLCIILVAVLVLARMIAFEIQQEKAMVHQATQYRQAVSDSLSKFIQENKRSEIIRDLMKDIFGDNLSSRNSTGRHFNDVYSSFLSSTGQQAKWLNLVVTCPIKLDERKWLPFWLNYRWRKYFEEDIRCIAETRDIIMPCQMAFERFIRNADSPPVLLAATDSK